MERTARSKFRMVTAVFCPVASVVLAASVAHAAPQPTPPSKGLTISMGPHAASLCPEIKATPVGPADEPTALVFSCPSEDLKTCLELMLREPEDDSTDGGESEYSELTITLRSLTSKGRVLPNLVAVEAFSLGLCGAQNCPRFVMRRTGPRSWEQVVSDFGLSIEAFDVAGSANPWISVDSHESMCESWVSIYEPVGRTYVNVANEVVNSCYDMNTDRRVATHAGIKYALQVCPETVVGPEGEERTPLFNTESFQVDDRFSFSLLKVDCVGWPKSDGHNDVFIIFDDARGGIPVTSGHGIGWRGPGRAEWLLFAPGYGGDGAEDPLIEPLSRADNLKPPPPCRPDACHRAVRWLAPGIVAIDWYRQTPKPSRAIRSDILHVPEVVR